MTEPSASRRPIAVTRFSTCHFAPADRHEAWANRDWPTIGRVFETRPVKPFSNQSDRFALGPLMLHVADMGAQSYERTAAMARADGNEALLIELIVAGQTRGDLDGRSVAAGDGAICLSDLSRPHTHVSTDSRTALITAPRMVAEAAGLDVGGLHGASIDARNATLLQSHLSAIYAMLPDLMVDQGERLAGTLLDLLVVALGGSGASAPAKGNARDTASAIAARRLIEDHLGSTKLSVDWLCGQLHIRRSTLYRLFAAHGGVATYIRQRRLERVRLAIEACPPARLTDLAERWGFSDASHLSRLFRAEYGVTPGDHRARSADPLSQP